MAIADAGRDGEVRFFGDIDSSPEAVGRLVAKLAKRHSHLSFCYEAGPTSYGLYRQITGLGHECMVGERKNPGLSGRQQAVRFRSQSAIQHRGADDGDAMSALRGPSHPLLLVHSGLAAHLHARAAH